MKTADPDDGLAAPASSGDRGGGSTDSSVELRELRKRTELLERENEILRRATAYFTRDALTQRSTRLSVNSPPRRSLLR